MTEHITFIACDESGAEGETLATAKDPVYVHGSVALTDVDAAAIMADLRTKTKSQAPELKSSVLLQPKHRTTLLALLAADGPLAGRMNLYFAEKTFFIVGKMIDLLVEEQANDDGQDLVSNGMAKDMALYLHATAPHDIGVDDWAGLLKTFNDLIRAYKRAGAKQPDAAVFIAELDRVRRLGVNSLVRKILDEMWNARGQAAQYEQPPATSLRDLEPTVPTLSAVIGTWRSRLGDVPMEFVVDEHWTLDPTARQHLIDVARAEIGAPGWHFPATDLRGITPVQSVNDPRVQVADVVAGVGRECAALAEQGVMDDPLQVAVRDAFDAMSMRSIGSPLDRLLRTGSYSYLTT